MQVQCRVDIRIVKFEQEYEGECLLNFPELGSEYQLEFRIKHPLSHEVRVKVAKDDQILCVIGEKDLDEKKSALLSAGQRILIEVIIPMFDMAVAGVNTVYQTRKDGLEYAALRFEVHGGELSFGYFVTQLYTVDDIGEQEALLEILS